ncbi:MAG: hypothetical protein GY705_07065 [Bacteroidetes bacterium]|nr:hypothetical protein [Bacteroidota bacterium]
MQTDYKSKYNAHLIKLIIAVIVFGIAAFAARKIFTPKSFGEYGHFRGADIVDQRNVPVRFGTNDSCFQCHKPIRKIHKKGVHQTVSCEICHGPYGDHIQGDQKVGTLPVIKGDEITSLCLRCHNQVIQARPRTSIKVVAMPNHLEDQKVRIDHSCDQCHMVHDPLLWINEAKTMFGIKVEGKK